MALAQRLQTDALFNLTISQSPPRLRQQRLRVGSDGTRASRRTAESRQDGGPSAQARRTLREETSPKKKTSHGGS